jgi:hypothetical protein
VAVSASSSAADHSSSVFVCPPNLVRGQAKVSERSPERLTAVDAIQELPAFLHRQPFLCSPPEACPGGLVLRFTASVTVAAFQPAGQGAVRRLWAASPTLRISDVADLVQLLTCPRRCGEQAEREPPPDDRRRHIAHRSGLAN